MPFVYLRSLQLLEPGLGNELANGRRRRLRVRLEASNRIAHALLRRLDGRRRSLQITQAVDTISGETIGYQYDALKRLISASSSGGWAQAYQYDGSGTWRERR
jgi:YD repeat-containing protein